MEDIKTEFLTQERKQEKMIQRIRGREDRKNKQTKEHTKITKKHGKVTEEDKGRT